MILIRRLSSFFSPYIDKIDFYIDRNGIFLRGIITLPSSTHTVRIKVDRLSRKLMNRLQQLEPAIISGKVKVEDVKYLLLGFYGSWKDIYMNRENIRRVSGLVEKDKSLLNYIIFRRVAATKIIGKGLNPKEVLRGSRGDVGS